MADKTPVVDPEQGKEEDPKDPKTFDLEYVQKLRSEAANYRTRLREVEKSQKDAEDARLAEQEEWKKLADQRATEIAELSTYKQQYDDMIESVAESNTKRIESIPEQMRRLVPEYESPLKVATWLDTNSQLLVKPTAPELNGKAGGGERPGETESLSADELAMSRSLGITAKEYQESKRG